MLGDVSEEVGLDMMDLLAESDAGSGSICVSSCVVASGVPFIATRCTSKWSTHGSSDKMVLKWARKDFGQSWKGATKMGEWS